MSERYIVESIVSRDDSAFDIVFIHGLGGDKYSTWQNDKASR
jgi:hypothetical protein